MRCLPCTTPEAATLSSSCTRTRSTPRNGTTRSPRSPAISVACAPDFWGCGESPPPPPGDPTLAGYAASVLAAMDALAIDRFTVVGLSMGGYIAFELWRLAPARIRSLALCSTRPGADDDARRDDRLAIAERVEREHSVESIVEPMLERLLGPAARNEVHIADPVRGRIRRCTPEGIAFAQRAMAARRDSGDVLGSHRRADARDRRQARRDHPARRGSCHEWRDLGSASRRAALRPPRQPRGAARLQRRAQRASCFPREPSDELAPDGSARHPRVPAVPRPGRSRSRHRCVATPAICAIASRTASR